MSNENKIEVLRDELLSLTATEISEAEDYYENEINSLTKALWEPNLTPSIVAERRQRFHGCLNISGLLNDLGYRKMLSDWDNSVSNTIKL